jgi:hypothetical protein
MKSTRYKPTAAFPCPHCARSIGYYRFSSMGELVPHFYCGSCTNVFCRESDSALVRAEPPSEALLARIAATLPPCPCGGRFGPNEDLKCPHCGIAIPNRLAPVERLTDPNAILVEGAVLVTEGL